MGAANYIILVIVEEVTSSPSLFFSGHGKDEGNQNWLVKTFNKGEIV